MATPRRLRLLSLLICAAVLLPALHAHPAPPVPSWTAAVPTSVATVAAPCLACTLTHESRSYPVASEPTLPPETLTPRLTLPGDVEIIPPYRRAGPLPARGPPPA